MFYVFACDIGVILVSVRFDDSVNRERVVNHSPNRLRKSSSDTDLARLCPGKMDFLARRGFDKNGLLFTSFY